MSYVTPTHVNDEAMEYVRELSYEINVGYDGENEVNSVWAQSFLGRLRKGEIQPRFTCEAFIHNKEIIDTLKVYGLDVEKFWFVLLFIDDITDAFSHHTLITDKSDYEVLVEADAYLTQHPQATLYLSEDRELRKSECYATNSLAVLGLLRRSIKQELEKYSEPPQLKSFTISLNKADYTGTLVNSQRCVLMYKLYRVLFRVLNLPDKRAPKRSNVSYSKILLICRIIYFCRLSDNESFREDYSAIKGLLKQYGDTDFNQYHPRTYWGGIILPKDNGE